MHGRLMSLFLLTSHSTPCYIETWLKPLKQDKREIFRAAADAQPIVDMVLGFHPDFAATAAPQPDRPHGSPVLQFNKEPAL